MLSNYLKELEKTFGEDAMSMMLLETTTTVYPLLTRFGHSFHAPLAVVVDDESRFGPLTEHLCGFGMASAVSLNSTPKKIEQKLEKPEYGRSVFLFKNGRYIKDNLETVESQCSQVSEKIDDQRMVIVLGLGSNLYKYMGRFAGYIYIKNASCLRKNNSDSCRKFQRFLIEKTIGKMDEIKYDIDHFCQEECDGFQIIWAAGALLKVILKYEIPDRMELARYEERINSALDMMYERWQDPEDPEEYISHLLRLMDEAEAWLPPMKEWKYTGSVMEEELEKVVFYDKRYYYISTDLFGKIWRPLLGQMSINHVKDMLCEAGVLDRTDASRTYNTAQKQIAGAHGAKKRKRFIMLVREKLDGERELSLLELLNSREEQE